MKFINFLNKSLNVKSKIYRDLFNQFYQKESESVKEKIERHNNDPRSALLDSSMYFKNGKLIKNHDKVVQRKASEETKKIINKFKEKQINKLVTIIKDEENISKIELLGEDINYLKIKITLKNNSEFTMVNKLVTVLTTDPPHSKYPTTFHDIKTVDGNFYKKRSQKWLIENIIA